jgi:phosphonate transport system permease protein
MNLRHSPTPSEELPPSLVPPLVAAVFSMILPGLGQILARTIRRGLLLFFSFSTIIVLLAWRFTETARRDTGFINIFKKGLSLDTALIILTGLVIVFYIWNVIDAYAIANRSSSNPAGLLFLVLVVFFMLGWQICKIDFVDLITQADDAGPVLTSILWPWEKAIEIPEDITTTIAEIQIPCTENPPVPNEPLEDEPYIIADPTCGTLAEFQGEIGTTLVLSGYNLIPNTVAELWWKDPIGNEFRQRQGGEYIKVIPDENGAFEQVIEMPYRLNPESIRDSVTIWELQTRQIASLGKWQFSTELKLAIEKIAETIFIGMMATFFGVILALPVSFLAARNLMSASVITLAIYFITRTVLNIIRSIEPLIWAIIFVIVVGLGPFAGVLALTVHSIAALGKLYSEQIESIDPGPIEAIQATGANWLQVVIYAVVPQIVPPFVSFTIYRWDINIRMSTIIGFVGGGGIGFLLSQWIRLLDYKAAGIAVWFIAITVAILDFVSAEIRQRFI